MSRLKWRRQYSLGPTLEYSIPCCLTKKGRKSNSKNINHYFESICVKTPKGYILFWNSLYTSPRWNSTGDYTINWSRNFFHSRNRRYYISLDYGLACLWKNWNPLRELKDSSEFIRNTSCKSKNVPTPFSVTNTNVCGLKLTKNVLPTIFNRHPGGCSTYIGNFNPYSY